MYKRDGRERTKFLNIPLPGYTINTQYLPTDRSPNVIKTERILCCCRNVLLMYYTFTRERIPICSAVMTNDPLTTAVLARSRAEQCETLVLSLSFYFFGKHFFGIDLFIYTRTQFPSFYLHSAGPRRPSTAGSDIIPNPHRRNR